MPPSAWCQDWVTALRCGALGRCPHLTQGHPDVVRNPVSPTIPLMSFHPSLCPCMSPKLHRGHSTPTMVPHQHVHVHPSWFPCPHSSTSPCPHSLMFPSPTSPCPVSHLPTSLCHNIPMPSCSPCPCPPLSPFPNVPHPCVPVSPCPICCCCPLLQDICAVCQQLFDFLSQASNQSAVEVPAGMGDRCPSGCHCGGHGHRCHWVSWWVPASATQGGATVGATVADEVVAATEGATTGAMVTDATMVVCATVGAGMVGEVVADVSRCHGGDVTEWVPSCVPRSQVPRHRHHPWAAMLQW